MSLFDKILLLNLRSYFKNKFLQTVEHEAGLLTDLRLWFGATVEAKGKGRHLWVPHAWPIIKTPHVWT